MDLVFAGDGGGYGLADSGGGRKLERFGGALLDRPAPQAIWDPRPDAPWKEARARFDRREGGTGDWTSRRGPLPDPWSLAFASGEFEIRLTGFGNVGLFPEHAAHFDWLAERLHGPGEPEVLNLFAYTGAASLACARAGARVTHVDAARQVNGWARQNLERSGVAEGAVRFLADDAVKLVQRELRRGRRYRGVIADPPSFGRGPGGEVWKLEEHLPGLVARCLELLADDGFLLLSAHSPGITPSVLGALLEGAGGAIETGEALLRGGGPPLPAGAYARLDRGGVRSRG
jgi:23S rRNA (cytosine1962-C5)-methyltransferase